MAESNSEQLWHAIRHILKASTSALHKLQIRNYLKKQRIHVTASQINKVLYEHKQKGELLICGKQGQKPLWKLSPYDSTETKLKPNVRPDWGIPIYQSHAHQLKTTNTQSLQSQKLVSRASSVMNVEQQLQLHNIMDEDEQLKIATERSLKSFGLNATSHYNYKKIKSVACDDSDGKEHTISRFGTGTSVSSNTKYCKPGALTNQTESKEKHREYTHHISDIIAHDFDECKNEKECHALLQQGYVTKLHQKYTRAYLYRIKYQTQEEDEKYNDMEQYSWGVISPSPIPTKYVESIRFPVLIQTQIDHQLRETIRHYLNSKDLKTSFNIYRSNQQISLELVPHTDIEHKEKQISLEHKLKPEWFCKIQNLHRFIFKLLDRNLTQDDNNQRRNYYICPVLQNQIDFDCINKLSVATSYKMNGKDYLKDFPSNLKYEMVTYQKQVCVSYGLCKGEYTEKREEANNSEASTDIHSMKTFASSTVVNFVNEFKTGKQKQNDDYLVLIRDTKGDNVENVLTKEAKSVNGHQLQCKMKLVPLKEIYPTGIKTTQYYPAKNLPSILWGIENYLNVIDLNEILSRKWGCNMDISLLFEALNRCASSDLSYQRYNKLGVYTLRALLTICAFSTNASADAMVIKAFVNGRATQHSSILSDVSQKLNLISYALLQDFHIKSWHPPGFEQRKRSIYTTNKNKKLCTILLQSVIGAYFASKTKQNCDNKLGNAMSDTFHLLHRLNIIPNTIVDSAFGELNDCMELGDDNVDKYIYSLSKLSVVNGPILIKNSKIMHASMCAVCHDTKDYIKYGISLPRATILGDALLDLFVVWFIYVNTTNVKSIKQVAEKKKHRDELRFWQQEIDKERFRWVNDKSLAARSLVFQQYIQWYSEEERAKITGILNEIDLLQEQETPSAILPKTGLKCLVVTFYALLAAIFLCGNEDIYLIGNKNINITNCYWKCALCIEFLIKFLGNEENWKQFKWRQWTS